MEKPVPIGTESSYGMPIRKRKAQQHTLHSFGWKTVDEQKVSEQKLQERVRLQQETDDKQLTVYYPVLNTQEQLQILRLPYTKVTDLALDHFFGAYWTPKGPSWYTEWLNHIDLPVDKPWNRIRIEVYKGLKAGYPPRQEPYRMGDIIGIVVLGDDAAVHRWARSGSEPSLAIYKRGTGLVMQGPSRSIWTRELIAKRTVVMVEEPHHTLKRMKRASENWTHWELIFYHSGV